MSMKFRNLRNFVIFTLKRKISKLENPLSLRRSYRSVKYFQQRSWLKDCLNLFQNKKKNYLSFKDPIPDALKSLLIYNFKYAGCNSCYIDQRDNSPIFHKGEGTSIDRQKFVYAQALASLS